MKYSRFELLAFIFGAGIIGVSVISAFRAGQEVPEIIALLLILLTLAGALHYGRNGGIVTFLIASMVYLVLKLPQISQVGLESSVVETVLIRLVIFGIVGILGGILASRLKYLFVSLEGHDFIDPVTSLYNANFFSNMVSKAIGQYDRYKRPFTILTIEFSETAVGQQPPQVEKRLCDIGMAIRNNLRLLDEVGRIGERRFAVLLTDTPLAGGEIVRKRMLEALSRLTKSFGHEIPVEILAQFELFSYPEDSERIVSEFPPAVAAFVPTPISSVASELDEHEDDRLKKPLEQE